MISFQFPVFTDWYCCICTIAGDLAWRELSRKYGANLAYTPMINAGVVLRNRNIHISQYFTTVESDRPLIAQFCGDDPDKLLEAARLVWFLFISVSLSVCLSVFLS